MDKTIEVGRVHIAGNWRPAIIYPGRTLLTVVYRVDANPGVKTRAVSPKKLGPVMPMDYRRTINSEPKPYPLKLAARRMLAQGRKSGITKRAREILQRV